MSQSDYIKYKRVQRELTELQDDPTKFPVVFESGKYISYKEYSLENTILSSTKMYDKIISSDIPVVFGMIKNCAADSPTFILCSGTNERGNRPTITENEGYPSFRSPKLGTITKRNRLHWKLMSELMVCKCANR